MRPNVVTNTLYYNALLAYYCFAIPYGATLTYCSGYGIATNTSNSKKTRLKGWLLYSLLWWLPFVASAIVGPFFLTYFVIEKLFYAGLIIAEVAPKLLSLLQETIAEKWQILKNHLLDVASAAKELFGDFLELIGDIISMLKESMQPANRPREENNQADANQRPWRHAILMAETRSLAIRCWQTLHATNQTINQVQERENQSLKRRKR